MKKRVSSLLLALSLLLTAPALAASDSTENFTRVKTYTGQFSDLAADSVFYDNVAALYEYGLSVGRSDGTYGARDSMTVGEIIIFAGRIRSLYRTGDPERGPAAYGGDGGPVALPYLLYLQAEGVLDTALDGSLSATATRAQVAHVLANILPEAVLPLINDTLITQALDDGRYMPDVTVDTPYRDEILKLYRTGVSLGSDAAGSFLPDASITRGAAAAMLTRLVDPSLRVTPDWTFSASYASAQGTTLASLVPAGTYIAAPSTTGELAESVRYMLSSGSNVMTLQYPGIAPLDARNIMESALAIAKTYCEQSYNSVSCTYNRAGSMVLTFSAAGHEEMTSRYRTEAMASAIAVHDQLWESGQLTGGMTEYEKARVYYTWVCGNCVYDYSADDSSLSHLPYSLFRNGTAVCDGYTGAYNMLLKLEGIDCTALSNSGHIWTVANLDGEQVHIDTTWGDSGSTVSYEYFAMTPEQSWRQHPW